MNHQDVQERLQQLQSLLKNLHLMKSNQLPGLESRQVVEKLIAGPLAKCFVEDCLYSDIFPPEELEGLFGVSTTSKGRLVYGAWQYLVKYGEFSENQIKESILAGNLPNTFESETRGFASEESPTNFYSKKLVEDGFADILWDLKTLNLLKRPSSS